MTESPSDQAHDAKDYAGPLFNNQSVIVICKASGRVECLSCSCWLDGLLARLLERPLHADARSPCEQLRTVIILVPSSTITQSFLFPFLFAPLYGVLSPSND